jgi:superfamily II DNA/RNA helicase
MFAHDGRAITVFEDPLSFSTNTSLRPATTTFAELGVPANLAGVLAASGITSPFPIQTATLPDSLSGRDLLGRGRTGSGKTLAFAIPLVARLAGGRSAAGHPRGLVLVPTRELANQVLEVIEPLARTAGLRATTVFGGVNQSRQVAALRSGVDILIACPGRLEDLVNQRHCHLDAIDVTVLDEADHMADLGFLPGVKRLLDRTPAGRQRLLFSATLDRGVDVLVKRYLSNPVTHAVDPVEAPVSAMEHHVFTVTAEDKNAVVAELAAGRDRSVLFTRTKHQARKLAKQLTAQGIPAVDLHGNLSQSARDRNLAQFKDGSTRVLVATDIAARGIHVDDITLVVHVDPPAEHKAYLHRSGRTARAGAAGSVVTIATRAQLAEVGTLTRQAGIKPRTANVRANAPEIVALRGERAAHVTPVVQAEPVSRQQPRNGGSGRPRSGGSGRPRNGGGRGR